MDEPAFSLEELCVTVQASRKYRAFDPALVYRLAAQELPKHKKLPAAVKAVRTRLHQMAGAYLAPSFNYDQLAIQLAALAGRSLEEQKPMLLEAMRLHASTRERLPHLYTFYGQTLDGLGPFSSVLDLACGLNPLAIPWMPLARNFTYHALDVVDPMLSALLTWFEASEISGTTRLFDLSTQVPDTHAELTLLLKTIPILDQIDLLIAPKLLAGLNTRYILVSFPAQSLGGRQKGMRATYTRRMEGLLQDLGTSAKSFEFPNELAWLIDKGA